MSKNVTITINATVKAGTDRTELEKRINDHLHRLANPVRDDKGLISIQKVSIYE